MYALFGFLASLAFFASASFFFFSARRFRFRAATSLSFSACAFRLALNAAALLAFFSLSSFFAFLSLSSFFAFFSLSSFFFASCSGVNFLVRFVLPVVLDLAGDLSLLVVAVSFTLALR